MSKRGVFTSNGVHVKVTELRAVEFFLANGYDVELVVPSYTPGNQNPDFLINGRAWELKTPISTNRRTIERRVKKAGHQSENVIVDLRFTKIPDGQCMRILENYLSRSSRIRRMVAIDKNGRLLTVKKKKNKIQ